MSERFTRAELSLLKCGLGFFRGSLQMSLAQWRGIARKVPNNPKTRSIKKTIAEITKLERRIQT